MRMSWPIRHLCCWAFALQAPAWAATPMITGAGSSAAAPIYQSWSREYQKAGGPGLAYESIGSSAGLKKIRARETGFGASDVAPPEAELLRDGLVVFPIAITGIAPVIHVPKLSNAQIRLSGELLARIFLGELKQWNAAEIAQLNPTLGLPDLPIKVVVRSDGSGTSYNFGDYLAKVSPTWKTRHGAKTSYTWPEGFIAAKGSDGVVKAVQETPGAIGYVDYGYVKDNKLGTVQLKNADGEFVKPSIEAFRSALSNSEWIEQGRFSTTLTQKSGKSSWPIAMGTFALVPQVTRDPEQTLQVLKMFVWAFMNGDKLVAENNFVRLPDRVQALAFKAITSVKDPSGRSVGMQLLNAASPTR
jgi:phosphate transport system substrate-binding protein